MTTQSTKYVQRKAVKYALCIEIFFILWNDLPVSVNEQSNHQSSNKGRQKRSEEVERRRERATSVSSEQSDSDEETPRAQYWFRVQRQIRPERAEVSSCVPQENQIPASPPLQHTRPTTSVEKSRQQSSEEPMEQEVMSEQSNNEGEEVTDNDNDSQYEQERVPCDTNYSPMTEEPQSELFRRSARTRRAPQTLT